MKAKSPMALLVVLSLIWCFTPNNINNDVNKWTLNSVIMCFPYLVDVNTLVELLCCYYTLRMEELVMALISLIIVVCEDRKLQ